VTDAGKRADSEAGVEAEETFATNDVADGAEGGGLRRVLIRIERGGKRGEGVTAKVS